MYTQCGRDPKCQLFRGGTVIVNVTAVWQISIYSNEWHVQWLFPLRKKWHFGSLPHCDKENPTAICSVRPGIFKIDTSAFSLLKWDPMPPLNTDWQASRMEFACTAHIKTWTLWRTFLKEGVLWHSWHFQAPVFFLDFLQFSLYFYGFYSILTIH